jgi:hypothetical protein
MAKQKHFDEYDFLGLFYQEMLTNGHAHNLVRLSVDARMVEGIYEKSHHSVTEDELHRLADICLANGWVKQTVVGAGKHGHLQLTTQGFGVCKSKQKQQEMLKSRSLLKKVSDYIEVHKGLFVLLGFVVAVIGVAIKYYGSNSHG